MEGGEEEHSFCHIINLWFKMLFEVCRVPLVFVALWTAPSSLGGDVLSVSTQSKAPGMGKADGDGAASHMCLPGDSSIPLRSLTRRVPF